MTGTEQDEAVAVLRDVDVVVAGAGMAGIAAAVCAARNGARTVLVERYGRLGGCATSSLVCRDARARVVAAASRVGGTATVPPV